MNFTRLLLFLLLFSFSPLQEVVLHLLNDQEYHKVIPVQESQSDHEEEEIKVKDQIVSYLNYTFNHSCQYNISRFDTSLRLHQYLPDTETPPPNF